MKQEVYCITHEKMVTKECGFLPYHSVPAEEDFMCEGPFTFTPPPDYDENWQNFVVLPSAEELIEMDKEAETLAWGLFVV